MSDKDVDSDPDDPDEFFNSMMAQLPGFEDKFNELSDPGKYDAASIRLLTSLIGRLAEGSDAPGIVVKGAYVLGAYNEFRGLHSTKQ